MNCGIALPAPPVTGLDAAPPTPEPPEQVRFVTVVFCDVASSTELAAGLSPDVWGAILARYFTTATEAFSAAGGRVEKFIGDAVVAVFGTDVAHEDDAVRAVRAACVVRDRVRAEGRQLRESRQLEFAVRIGVASGRVALASGRDSSFAIGAVLNRAARLQGAGSVGDVVVDARTWLLVRSLLAATPLGTVAAKGFRGGVRAWRIDGDDRAPSTDPVPVFVDREEVLAGLVEHLRAGLAGRAPAVALVEGELGIGKSRLVERCCDELAGTARRVVLRCTRDGSHLGLRSLLALEAAVAGPDPVAGSATSRSLAEVYWRIRVRLADAVRQQPLLLVVEDTQWAAHPLLDFLRTLSDQPLPSFAAVLTGRSDAPDGLPDLGPGVHHVRVPPLPTEHCRHLLDVVGGDVEPHAGAVVDEVIRASRGNPLYLTQMLTLAAEADGPVDLFPPSAEAVIGARVDRLPTPAQLLLAVIGAFGATAALPDLTEAATALRLSVDEPLAELAEQGFVAASGDGVRCLLPMAAEVVYRRLRLADRAAVHDRIAAALRTRTAREPALVELVAHHATTAHAAWRECEPGSGAERAAARAAMLALCAAARFAILYSAVPLAARHLAAARDLVGADRAAAVEVAAVEAYLRLAAGEPDAALAVADAALSGVDPPAHGAATADLMLTAAVTRELMTGVRDEAFIARARELAHRSGEPAAISRALLFEAYDAVDAGDYPHAQRALTDSANHARRATGCLSVAETYGNLALCLAFGDEPAAAALELCAKLYREAGDAQAMRAAIGCPMALLWHMLGRVDDGLTALDAAAAACERIGHRPGLAGVYVFRATLAERADDLPAALRHLATAAQLCAGIGLSDTARTMRLHHDMLSMLSGSGPVTGSAELGGTGWYDEVLALQLTALRRADPDPLRAALNQLARIRGSGAVSAPLLNCLRVARHLGAHDLSAECEVRLVAATRTKGDTWLLGRLEYP
jgi:class 3 adenylate cyclase